MKMEVHVISKETIIPSSPTPSHLKLFKLSYLDQISPTFFVPIVLFYPKDDGILNTQQYCNCLKESLSQCLSSFYPLAGRIAKENASEIDCTDAGVDFFEAQVMNCKLSDLINKPDATDLNQLLPHSTAIKFSCNTPLLAVQVNSFDCGGIAVAICMSHKIADASSILIFLKGWTSTTTVTSTATIINPRLDLASLFPLVRDLVGFESSTTNHGTTKQNDIVTKRFVFDASSISSIRHKLVANTNNNNCSNLAPTRVEAVSAFIIRHFMNSVRANKGYDRPVTALYAMNLRNRRVPPVPEGSFGNMSSTVIVPVTSNNMVSLVGKIRAAICEVDGKYVKKLELSSDWYLNYMKALLRSLKDEIDPICFSSWCRFGFYNVADFGWGRPIWVATSTVPMKNVIVLMDTPSGDGIEAWVNMSEEDMVEFERDEEFLAFASSSDYHKIST